MSLEINWLELTPWHKAGEGNTVMHNVGTSKMS